MNVFISKTTRDLLQYSDVEFLAVPSRKIKGKGEMHIWAVKHPGLDWHLVVSLIEKMSTAANHPASLGLHEWSLDFGSSQDTGSGRPVSAKSSSTDGSISYAESGAGDSVSGALSSQVTTETPGSVDEVSRKCVMAIGTVARLRLKLQRAQRDLEKEVKGREEALEENKVLHSRLDDATDIAIVMCTDYASQLSRGSMSTLTREDEQSLLRWLQQNNVESWAPCASSRSSQGNSTHDNRSPASSAHSSMVNFSI